MAYIRVKRIKGHAYLYEQESYRVGNKVKTRFVRYIGKAPLGTTEGIETPAQTTEKYIFASLAQEARRYPSAEAFAYGSKRIATRWGEVKTETGGQYFATAGMSAYFDPFADVGAGRNNYDISTAHLIASNTPEAKHLLAEAWKDPDNTPAALARLSDSLEDGYIDYHIADGIPAVAKVAKRLGYDGIKVWENDDVADPSSVLLWNTPKAIPIGDLTDFYNKAIKEKKNNL